MSLSDRKMSTKHKTVTQINTSYQTISIFISLTSKALSVLTTMKRDHLAHLDHLDHLDHPDHCNHCDECHTLILSKPWFFQHDPDECLLSWGALASIWHQEGVLHHVSPILPYHEHLEFLVLLLAHLVMDMLVVRVERKTAWAGWSRTGAETDGDRLEVRVTGVVLRYKFDLAWKTIR